MKYLMNMVNHESKLNWFNNDWKKLEKFLKEYNLDGVELIFYNDYNIEDIPKDLIEGMHLIYWPTWLDFWKGNKDKLLKQFINEENIISYYGDLKKQVMINKYKKEFEVAQALNSNYMVFHVSHVDIEHLFTWDFTYSDKEIFDITIELVNEVFGNEDKGVTLLFENLWWPGLNFNDMALTKNFFEQINYPNKGFMLDIGHLMITNKNINTMDEACDYIEEKLNNNILLEYIKGIHLNKSLTGKYLRQNHNEKIDKINSCTNFWDAIGCAREHVVNIDTHVPFDHKRMKDIIKLVNPEFVVYEFLPKNLDELKEMVCIQNDVLER
ncbi:MAG: sugar phosphate isomerase/epimerase family protein [Eubacteriaceae bacterium]